MKTLIKLQWNNQKNFFIFLFCVFMITTGGPAHAQVTPTPSPVSTSIPTCLPCVAEITIAHVTVTDDFGDCSDYDGNPDAGKIIGFQVQGSSHNACCDGPGSPRINIQTSYEHCRYIGKDPIDSVWATYYYSIAPSASCGDEAVFYVNGYNLENSYAEDHEILTFQIETDTDTSENVVCDTHLCESQPEPIDIVLEAEACDGNSGITILPDTITGCDDGDWLRFDAVDFGTAVYYKAITLFCSWEYTQITNTIEVRLDSLDGELLNSFSVYGTNSTFSEKLIPVPVVSGVHDLYLVFRNGSDICSLDWVKLGPEPPLPEDPWVPTPLPTPVPTPTASPEP
jgi:hypothetical protein